MGEKDKLRLPIEEEGLNKYAQAILNEDGLLSPRDLSELARCFDLDYLVDDGNCSSPSTHTDLPSNDETKVVYRLFREIDHYRSILKEINESSKLD